MRSVSLANCEAVLHTFDVRCPLALQSVQRIGYELEFAEPPRKSVSQHGSQNLGTPLHRRGDDDEESSGKNMQKQPQHGTKKSQAGGWPKKRLKNDGNVTLF